MREKYEWVMTGLVEGCCEHGSTFLNDPQPCTEQWNATAKPTDAHKCTEVYYSYKLYAWYYMFRPLMWPPSTSIFILF
jgi:hypothetical protein